MQMSHVWRVEEFDIFYTISPFVERAKQNARSREHLDPYFV